MQHYVDYSVCANQGTNVTDVRRCKNKADRNMVEALDEVPYKERQWGHWLARNTKNTKQKLGLGIPKNGESRRVLELWQERLADELHKPIRLNFTRGGGAL